MTACRTLPEMKGLPHLWEPLGDHVRCARCYRVAASARTAIAVHGGRAYNPFAKA